MVAELKLKSVNNYMAISDTSTLIELIGGEIVVPPPPTPEHQDISANLRDVLKAVAEVRGLGRWYSAPLGLYISGYDVLEPDLMLFATGKRPGRHENPIEKIPSIVIEILSPSTRSYDLREKLVRYAGRGIPEYWIADPVSRSITINILDAEGVYLPHIVGRSPIEVGQYAGITLPLDAIFES